MTGSTNNSQGMLLFHLTSANAFAIATLKVRELVPFKKLTHLPHSHPAVLGAASIRQQTIPIIDMAAAIGYRPMTEQEKAQGQIIITDCQRQLIGFLINKVDKIAACNWREITAPPDGIGKKSFLTGVAKIDKQLVQLLDVELLLAKIFPANPSTEKKPLLSAEAHQQLKELNILLVDDSLVARKQLCDALSDINIRYTVTDNGTHALELMNNAFATGAPFNLLVSDIEMPGLDGYELTFNVRNNRNISTCYIILHTSLSSSISVSQAKQVGADEALTKFDAEELIQAMLRGALKTRP